MFTKKGGGIGWGVGGCCLTNPSYSRISLIFFNLTRPLIMGSYWPAWPLPKMAFFMYEWQCTNDRNWQTKGTQIFKIIYTHHWFHNQGHLRLHMVHSRAFFGPNVGVFLQRPKCSTRHQNWMTGADWQFTTTWRETSSFRWMGVENYTLAHLVSWRATSSASHRLKINETNCCFKYILLLKMGKLLQSVCWSDIHRYFVINGMCIMHKDQ